MEIRLRRAPGLLARLDDEGIELFRIEDARFRRWTWPELCGVVRAGRELTLVPRPEGRYSALARTIPVTGHRLLRRDLELRRLFTLDFPLGTRPRRGEVERYLRRVAPHLDWDR